MFFKHSNPSLREIRIYSNYKDIISQRWKEPEKKSQYPRVCKILAQEQSR